MEAMGESSALCLLRQAPSSPPRLQLLLVILCLIALSPAACGNPLMESRHPTYAMHSMEATLQFLIWQSRAVHAGS